MAKKKTRRPEDHGLDMCQFILKQIPGLAYHAATLEPFDDVLTGYGCKDGDEFFGIDIAGNSCVHPSGDYDRYGAWVYADRVVMFVDTYSEGSVIRESCETDLPGLWSFLRQLPRPMHSFGKWKENE